MKKIMFCGGGSAGHVTPNLALCEELKNRYELCYLGTDAIEKQLCQRAGLRFLQYKAVKLVRGKLWCNLKIPFALVSAVRQCKKLLSEERPDLLFSKGGYVSIAPVWAAGALKIPVLTHESDISAGLANRLIARKCVKVLTTFPSTAQKFRNGVCTGSPMRPSLLHRDKLECKQALGLDMRPTVLVFGGGSGSERINACLRSALPDIAKDYNILHICGKGRRTESNIRGYHQFEFADDMGLMYAAADYAVARCGSNSANELTSLKIPTLFIPLDNAATRGDQVENAKYFLSAGLCRVLEEKQLTPDRLTAEVRALVADEKLKAALDKYVPMRGNKNILREIERAINR